jgi:hypothetical protein
MGGDNKEVTYKINSWKKGDKSKGVPYKINS